MKRLNASLRHVRGQGMTEYIIIVALIAVAAIGVYNMFGKTVRNQTAGMAAALAGDTNTANNSVTNAGTSATNASTLANKTGNLSTFTKDTGKK